jgi:AcrR family transcriptional regulator
MIDVDRAAGEGDSEIIPIAAAASPKVRRSRTDKALHEAMLRLLENKVLDQITVRELCTEADVHPATFFRRHESKEALLDQIASDQINRLVELTLPIDRVDSLAAFFALFAFVSEHKSLWSALLNGGAGGTMRTELLKISLALATEMEPPGHWLPTELATLCTVSTIVETIAWWTRQSSEAYPPEIMAAKLHRLIKSISRLEGEDHPT